MGKGGGLEEAGRGRGDGARRVGREGEPGLGRRNEDLGETEDFWK